MRKIVSKTKSKSRRSRTKSKIRKSVTNTKNKSRRSRTKNKRKSKKLHYYDGLEGVVTGIQNKNLINPLKEVLLYIMNIDAKQYKCFINLLKNISDDYKLVYKELYNSYSNIINLYLKSINIGIILTLDDSLRNLNDLKNYPDEIFLNCFNNNTVKEEIVKLMYYANKKIDLIIRVSKMKNTRILSLTKTKNPIKDNTSCNTLGQIANIIPALQVLEKYGFSNILIMQKLLLKETNDVLK